VASAMKPLRSRGGYQLSKFGQERGGQKDVDPFFFLYSFSGGHMDTSLLHIDYTKFLWLVKMLDRVGVRSESPGTTRVAPSLLFSVLYVVACAESLRKP